jgi:virginiamycin B lyase
MNMSPPRASRATAPQTLGIITEYRLNWPGGLHGSTHELAISERFIFVTGQNMHRVAKFNYQGKRLACFKMPDGSGPHGILLDKKGRLWVSLEFHGQVVRLDDAGEIVETIDVKIHARGAKPPINPAPHGIGLDADGETIWFTGKRTSTIGRIHPDRSVEHFPLNTLAALPIFLSAGPDGGILGTELFGGSILHVSGHGVVREFPIPTANCRPIAVIPDPAEKFMWFTEESGLKIGKISPDGKIAEYPVPALQKNDVLASLAFDREGNLWVQVYVDAANPVPPGRDYILKFDKSIRNIRGNDLSGVPFVMHALPSKMSMMHRIKMDYAGNLWFTEMMTDKLGKISINGK